MADIYKLDDNGSGGTIPAWMPFLNGNGNGFGFGNGMNGIVDLFGLAIIASIFGWNGNGFGGGFGSGNGAGFLSNQINNDSGRELIMNAINSNGEASRSAIQNLATMLGQDYNTVFGAVQNVQNALATLASQQGMSTLQVINAIQSGDASLASQFQKCCCDNQLAICQQTNALQSSINNVGQQVAAKAAADQLAMCQQTYNLTDTMNRNYQLLDNKIDAVESSRKDREITSLTAQVAKLESQNFTAGIVQQAVAPVVAQLNSITREVDDIKNKIPNTVPVTYPNLSVVNNTPYMGGYGYGYGYGNNVVF